MKVDLIMVLPWTIGAVAVALCAGQMLGLHHALVVTAPALSRVEVEVDEIDKPTPEQNARWQELEKQWRKDSIERPSFANCDWPLPRGTYDHKIKFPLIWGDKECETQKAMRNSEGGFFMDDPDFDAKECVHFRRLTECGF